MPTYKIQGEREALLCKLSKELSIAAGKRVSKTEALCRILDVVIEEERLFSIREQPLSFFRRNVITQPTKGHDKSSESILMDAIQKGKL